jgi:hypothetical protein
MPKQPIVGQGTQDSPYRYVMGPTKRPPRECADPKHSPEHLLWFIPTMPSVKRCPWCSSERPSAVTLKIKQRMTDIKAGVVTKAAERFRMVQVDKAEWAAFKHFQPWLTKCRADASRLSGERTTHDFGIYGKIKATEREIRLAELEAATCKADPTPVAFLSLATGLTVSEIEALRAGAGANPDYPYVAAFYQLRTTRSEMLEVMRDYKSFLATPLEAGDKVGLKERQKAYGDMLKAENQLLDLLPKPKKKEQLDLGGSYDSTPAEDLAMRAVADFALTEPPALDGRPGGPGPLR